MEVRELALGEEPLWDNFVREAPEGTFFHLSGWREVLVDGLGHRAFYLGAFENGKLTGVLPLGQIKSRLFGNALISTPFCVYGGILAASAAARTALEDAACKLARDLQVDYLEMRNRQPVRSDWPSKSLYATFRKEVSGDDEKNMLAIPKKQRAMIRKGMRNDLTFDFHSDLPRFYRIYAESVRNLGTPVFPMALFKTLTEVFRDSIDICSVQSGGEEVASVMSCYFRDEVLPYFGGSTLAARAVAANDFMYWQVMSQAVRKGVRLFDFGRSKRDTGPYRFKKHWGFEPQTLSYEYYLVKAAEMPNLSPTNPRYKLLISTWKKLPLWAANLLGPRLARYLG